MSSAAANSSQVPAPLLIAVNIPTSTAAISAAAWP
jgi:hypothetical protein